MKFRTTVAMTAVLALASHAELCEHFPLGSVKVGGEIGRRIDLTLTNNLLKIDVDKLYLGKFAKKDCKNGEYAGAGKMLDSAVAFAKYSGSAEAVAYKDHFRDELIRCQEPDGYIGLMKQEYRMAMLWDIHEQGYLLQGLLSDYREFGSGKSLAAAKKIGDYFIANWNKLPADWGTKYVGKMLGSLGLPQGMVKLHKATGEKKYLDFALDTLGYGAWHEPIVFGRDELVLGHVYSYMAYCLGQQDLYRLSPNEDYLRATKRAMKQIFEGGSAVVTGAVGIDECWTADQDGGPGLGETCSTIYLVFNYDSLLRLNLGDPVRLGDAMERTVFNAVFSAQTDGGRGIRYYTPLLGERQVFRRDDYCCPNNYRRLLPRLSQYALYRAKDGILANLYTPCEAVFEAAGTPVRVTERTAYPNDGRVDFEVTPEKPAAFAFSFRIPRWCAKPSLRVNGESVAGVVPGTFAKVSRTWKAGDRVELDLPMEIRCVRGHLKQAGLFAVLRGPLVYALNPATIRRLNRVAHGDSPDAFALQRDKRSDASPYELGNMLRIDPRYLSFSNEKDESFRPDGTKIVTRVCLERTGVGVSQQRDPVCTLTEYADPANVITFFRMPGYDSPALTEDEIFCSARTIPR